MPDNKELNKIIDLITDLSAQRKKEKNQIETDRQNLIAAIGKDLSSIIAPVLRELASQGRINRQELASAFRESISDLNINVAAPNVSVDVPPIKVPAPQVTVNSPIVNIPPIKVPEAVLNMPEFINAKLSGISTKYPLPVILTNERGEPYSAGSIMSGGGGGVNAFKQITALVRDLVSSTGASLINPDGQLRVAVNATGGGTQFADGDARGTATGTLGMVDDGTSIQSQLGSSYGVQGVMLTDFDSTIYSVANPFPIRLSTVASDFNTSVSVSSFASSIGASILNGDGGAIDPRDRNWTITETLSVKQVSGAIDSIEIASLPFTLDVKQVSGSSSSIEIASQPFTLDIKQVSGSTDSISFVSQTIGMEVKQVSGFNDSVFVTGASGTIMAVGDVSSDVADTDTAPIKVGGIARTANPTAVTAGDRVSATYDDIGRQVMRPLQVRDLLTTAYATLSTNSETTLLASGAGVFNDLLYIAFANTSAGAVDIDIRDATGAGILATFTAPADSTTGVSLAVPIPQNVAADTWTVDFNTADVSNTTVYVNALFSKEV